MPLRVVGAGVGRTGTLSLKLALERLLGGPCYHMLELFQHPEHLPLWHQAAQGRMPEWDQIFGAYAACVDWPAASFWPEISAAYPDALILHSKRSDPETWWRSADATILRAVRQPAAGPDPWREMWNDLARSRFSDRYDDAAAWMAAYERHNDTVLATAAPERLLVWEPGDGWEPLCAALGLAVPDEPFPHVNKADDWAARGGPPRLDAGRPGPHRGS